LFGQAQKTAKGVYRYYRHSVFEKSGKCKCKAFTSISASKIENAVFNAIFENVRDEVGFRKAIQESLPDVKMINSLKSNITKKEKRLKQNERKLDKLVDMAIEGTLKKETIKKKETELLDAKDQIQKELESDKQRLKSMPDIEQVEFEAKTIRENLMKYFQSKDRLDSMTYDEKRSLLHWLFDGKDFFGDQCGIYIDKQGEQWHYALHSIMTLSKTYTIFTGKDYKINRESFDAIHTEEGL
jgi:hypothetical protein